MKPQGTIRSGAFDLGYRIEGDGPSALVIGSSVYYPRTFSRELRKRLRLVFADHRGFAPRCEEVPVSEYALDRVLDDMELVRSELGLGKVILIGHSGHGYMALEYAKRFPRNVSHLAIVATGPSHGSHMALAERYWREAVCPERKARFERDMALLPGDIEADPENRFVHFCVRMGAKAWYDPEFDARQLWQGVHVNMAAFDHLFGEVFRDIDVARGLEALDLPVLLALGRFDYQVAPYSAWEPYRRHFRDLTVRVFDRSGHTPQLEESANFDAELLAWLESRPARNGA